MLKKMVLLLTVVIVVCFDFVLFADEIVVPEKIEKENFPPLTTTLLKKERENRSAAALKNIETVVKKVVDKKEKKEKRSYKRSYRENKQPKDVVAKKEGDLDAAEKELKLLLEHFFQEPALLQKNVSIHFKDMPLRKAIASINKLSGMQFVLDPHINSVIDALDVEDISLAVALKLLLSNSNPPLALIKDVGIWRIVSVPVARECLRVMVYDSIEKNYCHAWVTIQYAKWDDQFKKRIEKLWEGMVGEQKGKTKTFLVFDDSSKKIFFRGHASLVDTFKTLLAEIDVPVAQIRLEARVVLANKNFEESLGFQWVGYYDRSASLNHFDFAALGTKAVHATTLGNVSEWSLNMIPTKSPSDAKAKGMGIIPFIFGNKSLDTKRLNIILNAAESKSEIKTILKPTLLVNSEEWAEVLVGEALPVQTKIDESVGANIANVSTTQYKDIGMKLKVRPVVSPGNQKVFLDIFVENSYVGESKVNVPLADSGVFNYTIETSRSKSKVLLNSGQTTLISGLISNYQKNVKTGMPFLKDFPVLGWLFSGSQKVVEDKELLIFITPVVVS